MTKYKYMIVKRIDENQGEVNLTKIRKPSPMPPEPRGMPTWFKPFAETIQRIETRLDKIETRLDRVIELNNLKS